MFDIIFYISGLNRSAFDNKTVSFEEHIKCEHNMWHYLYFIVLVKVKDPTEFTGPESYVYAMVKVLVYFIFEKLILLYLKTEMGNEPVSKINCLSRYRPVIWIGSQGYVQCL